MVYVLIFRSWLCEGGPEWRDFGFICGPPSSSVVLLCDLNVTHSKGSLIEWSIQVHTNLTRERTIVGLTQQLISTVLLSSVFPSLSLFSCPPPLISVALCLSLCPHQVLSSSLAGSFAGYPPLISELSGWVSPSFRWMFLFFSFSWPSSLTPHTLSFSLSLFVCDLCFWSVCGGPNIDDQHWLFCLGSSLTHCHLYDTCSSEL